jgi:membrane-associated phospholipid phosphatase
MAPRSFPAGPLVLSGLFALLGDAVEERTWSFDLAALDALHRHASPERTRLMRLATHLGGAWIFPVVLVVVVVLVVRRRPRVAAVVCFGCVGIQAVDALLKWGYGRDRPHRFPPLTSARGGSFPSGHVMTALVAFGLLAVLLRPALHGWPRRLPAAAAVGIVGVVGLSRVYLGVHYPTDVLGSVLAGGAWLWGAVIVLRRAAARDGLPRPTALLNALSSKGASR